MKSMICKAILVILLLATGAVGETAGQVMASVYNRGIYFDADRYDTAVMIGFIDDAASLIATVGKTQQRCTTFALGTGYAYAMPSDFYAVSVAVLNADPDAEPIGIAVPKVLLYSDPESYGSLWAADAGRPQSFTIWADTLRLNRPSMNYSDTLTVWYYGTCPEIDAATDTVGLPDVYLPLLKDVVVQLCIWRVEYPDAPLKDEALALTKLIEEALSKRENE